jgi:hypothetical protein
MSLSKDTQVDTPIGVVRMDAEESYAGIGELLKDCLSTPSVLGEL